MAEVVRDEYATGIPLRPVPCSCSRATIAVHNVDKMVLKEADVLPHGLINEIETKLGRDGELLLEYVAWVRDRIIELRTHPGYSPRLYFDVYGTIGVVVRRRCRTGGGVSRPVSVTSPNPSASASSTSSTPEAVPSRFAFPRRCEPRSEAAAATCGSLSDEWCNTLEDIELFVAARAADVIHVKTPDLGGHQQHHRGIASRRAAWARPPTAGAVATKPTDPRRSRRTSRWPAELPRCWPSREWASTRE